MPALTDFTEIKAEVRVPYDDWGPTLEKSRPAADPVGAEHCGSLGKRTVLVSARTVVTRVDKTEFLDGTIDSESGVHIFLYRCEDDGEPVKHVEGVGECLAAEREKVRLI